METAFWVTEEELKHYTHSALIDTGAGDIQALRDRAFENCQVLKNEYLEIKGSLDNFHELIYGPHCDNEFLTIPPDHEVTEEMFLGS
ncbi:MAG: DUF1638 domain-containing protein [Desulfomonilaceae bacterium]